MNLLNSSFKNRANLCQTLLPLLAVCAGTLPLAALAQSEKAEPKKDPLKISLRVQVDPFVKNFNDSGLNLKQPKLDTLRVKFDRDLGENSQADAELRLNEFDAGGKPTGSKGGTAFQGALRYFHLVYRTPIEGLSVAYVRELESGNYGYTDRLVSSIFASSGGSATGVGFTGHLGRTEGFKLIWGEKDLSNLKISYLFARDQNVFNDAGDYKPNPNDRNWYQKITTSSTIADTNLEAGVGFQGAWIPTQKAPNAEVKYENKPDLFIHATAEFVGVEDLKVKAGLSWDSYANQKRTDSGETKTDANTVTTLLLSTRYDVLKELGILGELDYRTVKWANKAQVNYSKESKVAANKDLTDKTTDMQVLVGAQYFLDSKLSILPNYALYLNHERAQNADTSTATGQVVRKALVKGKDRNTASNESTFGVRIRYDY